MLELINNFIQGLNAKELELSKEMELENNPELEENLYVVEYFEGEKMEVKTQYIVAKTPTNAWIKALVLGLEIKELYLIKGSKKILVELEDLNVGIINTYIEKSERKAKTIYMDLYKTSNITKAMEILVKYNMTVKGVKDINNYFYELELIDNDNNYMLMHFKENTMLYFR